MATSSASCSLPRKKRAGSSPQKPFQATRLDAIIAQRADHARRDAEREAEEEAKRIQAELDALPDPDDPDPDAHHPTGDLHSLPATEDPEV